MIQVNGVYFPFEDFFQKHSNNVFLFGQGTRNEALKHVKNHRTAIDIGGHIGISVNCWAPLFEKVIAFEPMVDHYECLLKNTAKFNNVEAHNCAISNESRILRGAYRTGKNSGSFQLLDEDWSTRKKTKIYDIPSRRLDEFEFENVDLIKVDVEGWEFEVLKGSISTIQKHRPVLMIEFTHGGGHENKSMHHYDVDAYLSLIKELEYKAVYEGDDTIYVPLEQI